MRECYCFRIFKRLEVPPPQKKKKTNIDVTLRITLIFIIFISNYIMGRGIKSSLSCKRHIDVPSRLLCFFLISFELDLVPLKFLLLEQHNCTIIIGNETPIHWKFTLKPFRNQNFDSRFTTNENFFVSNTQPLCSPTTKLYCTKI